MQRFLKIALHVLNVTSLALVAYGLELAIGFPDLLAVVLWAWLTTLYASAQVRRLLHEAQQDEIVAKVEKERENYRAQAFAERMEQRYGPNSANDC